MKSSLEMEDEYDREMDSEDKKMAGGILDVLRKAIQHECENCRTRLEKRCTICHKNKILIQFDWSDRPGTIPLDCYHLDWLRDRLSRQRDIVRLYGNGDLEMIDSILKILSQQVYDMEMMNRMFKILKQQEEIDMDVLRMSPDRLENFKRATDPMMMFDFSAPQLDWLRILLRPCSDPYGLRILNIISVAQKRNECTICVEKYDLDRPVQEPGIQLLL